MEKMRKFRRISYSSRKGSDQKSNAIFLEKLKRHCIGMIFIEIIY